MPPPDWNLSNLITQISCDHEGFKIKSKSIDLTTCEHVLCNRVLEQFEPTLGVLDPAYRENLHGKVKSAPEEFTVKWLTHFKTAFLKRSAADGDLRSLERIKEFFNFFDRSRKVGVRKEKQFCFNFQHPASNDEPFPTVRL